MDLVAAQLDSGRSQVRAFDITNLPEGRPYDYPSEGRLMGWGLRNSVGVAEHPVTGGIYSVENSADQVERNGTDVHENNPGEEMNFLGYLNCSTEDQGANYGYPVCFALWDTDGFPGKGDMTVGSQFALNISEAFNDTTCAQEYVPPRLTFPVSASSPLSSSSTLTPFPSTITPDQADSRRRPRRTRPPWTYSSAPPATSPT